MLKEMSKFDMGSARDQLIATLSSFYPWCWQRIIVVFDGQNYSWLEVEGIEIVYTSEKETADTMIEKLSAGLSQHYQVLVATSDNEEFRAASALGARAISAATLTEVMNECRDDYREKTANADPVKGVMIHELINKKVKEDLEKLRRK